MSVSEFRGVAQTDVLNKHQRSYCMSRIRGKDTKPELVLRRALWGAGLRYRTNHKLFGKPDIVFVRRRVVVFVDGCFWHGCPEHYRPPKTSGEFWQAKVAKNKLRDKEVTRRLQSEGWRVLRFWEHEACRETKRCVTEIMRCVQDE